MRLRTCSLVGAGVIGLGVLFAPMAHAEPIGDQTAPKITAKSGTSLSSPNRSASFALSDNVTVDFVTVNGVKTDLNNNRWSDLNSLRPGLYGAKEGVNTVAVFDTSGNSSSVTVVLDTLGPRIEVKSGSIGVGSVFRSLSIKLTDDALVDSVMINGVVKDLSNNKWSDVNFIKPGVFGAVEGQNVFEAFDALGNKSSWSFVLDTTAPVPSQPTFAYDNSKGEDRTLVTVAFNEPTIVSTQGWYAADGGMTAKSYVYTRKVKELTINFTDVAGNPGTFTFTFKPASAPAPTPALSFGSSGF